MAVPVRGKLLAESLSPIVGTLLETHPRACLMLGLDKSSGTAVRKYKKSEPSSEEHVVKLLQHWCGRYHISTPTEKLKQADDGYANLKLTP
jgi:hypothetical protein